MMMLLLLISVAFGFAPDEVLPSVVRINANGGLGTGFAVSTPRGGVLLTNAHVCDSATLRVLVESEPTGLKYKGLILARYVRKDICIITLPKGWPLLHLRNSPPLIGDPIAIVGHPGGGPMKITRGFMRGWDTFDALYFCKQQVSCRIYIKALEVSALVVPGNSGSPVLDDTGAVVGMVVGGSLDGRINDVIPARDITLALTEWLGEAANKRKRSPDNTKQAP